MPSQVESGELYLYNAHNEYLHSNFQTNAR